MTRRRLMSVGLLLLILVASSCIRLVKDIARGPNGSDPSAPTVASEVLYFVADDESRGSELWRSDGTEAGTHLYPGPAGSEPRSFTVFSGGVYFSAEIGMKGRELVAWEPPALL